MVISSLYSLKDTIFKEKILDVGHDSALYRKSAQYKRIYETGATASLQFLASTLLPALSKLFRQIACRYNNNNYYVCKL